VARAARACRPDRATLLPASAVPLASRRHAVLPAQHRLRLREEHRAVVRRGARASAGPLSALVLLAAPGPSLRAATDPVHVGFTVGRPVGSAVVRNRVRRRLRALAAHRLMTLPVGCLVVVRAGAGVAELGYDELGRQLDSALSGALARARRTRPGRPR